MRIETWHQNLAALCFAQGLNFMAVAFVNPFIPLYVQSLGVEGTAETVKWAGLIVGATPATMIISQPIWGILSDRFGRKPMLIRSLLGGALMTLLMAFATSPEQAFALRLLQGFLSGTHSATNSLVAGSTPKHRLGFALGLIQVATFSATSLGPLIGGVIADTLGFRGSFLAASAIGVLAALIAALWVREDRGWIETAAPSRRLWADSHTTLAVAGFPVLIGVIFLITYGNWVLHPVLSLYIAQLSKAVNAATVAGIILAGTGVLSAFSAFGIGRIADRVGYGKILLICLLGTSITCYPQAVVQEVWQLAALRFLMGLFIGGLMPSANALVAIMMPPERRGAAFGLVSSGTSAAMASAPLIGAGIATQWGMPAVFFTTGILFTLAFGWVSLATRSSFKASSVDPRVD